jgi:sugar (pentulose or hexulose) kinase
VPDPAAATVMLASSDLAVAALGMPVGVAEADVLVRTWMVTANIAVAMTAVKTRLTVTDVLPGVRGSGVLYRR